MTYPFTFTKQGHPETAMADEPMADEAMAIADPSPRRGSVDIFTPDNHLRPIADVEADLILLAIGHYRGRMSEVARRLGIGRSTLYRRLAELGIERPR